MKKLIAFVLGLFIALPVFAGECNLFDRDTMGTVQSVSLANTNGDNKIFYNSGSNSVVMPCEPNVNYTISFGGNFEGSMFRVATTERLVTSADDASHPYTPITIVRQTTGDPITINSGANAHYLYIQVSAVVFQSMINILQVETGTTATTFKRYDANCGVNTCPNGGTLQTYTSATGTVTQNGTPTPTNPIEPVFYTQGDMVLRKVGNYADSYDATTGKITRRVGVKVLDGTEEWYWSAPLTSMFCIRSIAEPTTDRSVLSNQFRTQSTVPTYRDGYCVKSAEGYIGIGYDALNGDVTAFKAYLAQQYAAGTPVIIYYPLVTPVEEDWPATQCTTPSPIKIATTKYNNTAFGPVVTALSNAVDTIKTVVANTINQATAVANLQSGKQTKPTDTCPNGKICLLVEDEAGTPHWYEIIERAPGIVPAGSGYTQVEYLQSDGNAYINTGIVPTKAKQTKATVRITPTALPTSGVYAAGAESNINYAIQDGVWRLNGVNLTSVPANTTDIKTIVLQQTTSSGRYYSLDGVTGYGSDLTQSKVFSIGKLSVNASYFFPQKIYSGQIEENGTVVFDGVPARRNSDGVLGMYDTVSGNFFTNAGSGEFLAPVQ